MTISPGEREGMAIDKYLELSALLGIRKERSLPLKDLEEKVYKIILKETMALIMT